MQAGLAMVYERFYRRVVEIPIICVMIRKESMAQNVGFIKSLSHYFLVPYWYVVFEEMGFSIKQIDLQRESLTKLLRPFEGDFCFPLKYYLAQAAALTEDVDYLFVPLSYNFKPDVYACPKVIMAGELLRLYLRRRGADIYRWCLPVALSHVCGRGRFDAFRRAVLQSGIKLGMKADRIDDVCGEAERQQLEYEAKSAESLSFMDEENPMELGKDVPRVLMLGHRYSVHSSLLNGGVPDKIRAFGLQPVAREHRIGNGDRKGADPISRLAAPLYFSEAEEIFRAASAAAADPAIKGIIYVAMMNCGFDAVIEDVVQKKIIKGSGKPYLHLLMDEHSSTTSLVTQLEVFVDVIKEKMRS